MDVSANPMPSAAKTERAVEANRYCPRLPPVLSVLVCGHMSGDRKRIEGTLDWILRLAFENAQEVFDRPGSHYSGTPRLRVIAGDDDGVAAFKVAQTIDGADTVRVAAWRAMGAPPANHHHLCFNLPGEVANAAVAEDVATKACDELQLAHADLVIAVWSGGSADKEGATLRRLHAAALARKPAVWVEGLEGERGVYLLNRTALLERHLAALQGAESMADTLRACFRPFDAGDFRRDVRLQFDPTGGGEHTTPVELSDLFAVSLPGLFWRERSGALDALMWHIAGLSPVRAVRELLRGFGGAAGKQSAERFKGTWTRLLRRSPPPEDEPPLEIDPLYIWADAMANSAAGRHRVSVWMVSVCGALAVFSAVCGSVAGEDTAWHDIAPIGEVVVLLLLIGLLLLDRHQRWHQRWLFCRFIAEQVRVHGMLEPLYGTAPAALRPAWRSTANGLHFEDAGAWVVQRWIAGRGLLHTGADRENALFGKAAAAALTRTVERQANWLKSKHHDLKRQHRNLEGLSLLLFVAAFAGVLAHFFTEHASWLLFATAFLPAGGAAVASILNQAEVHRVAHGYGKTARRLHDIAEAVADEDHRARHANDPLVRWLHVMQVRRLGLEAGRVLAEENQAWYDLMSSRPLTPP